MNALDLSSALRSMRSARAAIELKLAAEGQDPKATELGPSAAKLVEQVELEKMSMTRNATGGFV